MTSDKKWCLDSGCTSHLCNDPKKFVHFSKVVSEKLNLASNTSTAITGRGTIHLNTEVDGKSKSLNLENALHVPDLRTNLLYVSKITDKGLKVVFDGNAARVIDRDGNTKLEATRVNGLYSLQENKHECRVATATGKNRGSVGAPMETWHRRMDYLNIRHLSASDRDGTVRGISIVGPERDFKCEVCVRCKMTKTPFPKRSDRQTELLDLIHSDVCGPMKIESIGESRYFVTFFDDCSRWCVIQMLKSKNEVFGAFKHFKTFVENQTGHKIKCLQSDNGKEYVNQEFDDFLKKNGIKRRLTVTHTPEQNGVAEGKNRTLVKMGRCLLIQSNLPSSFWEEAINTANYIRNRCPTNSLNGKTPHEKWTGNAPHVGHFWEFGCQVYSLNREPNKGNFQS